MNKLARHLRVGAIVIGLPALMAACSGMSADDRALLEQARADASAASAAADRASQAAEQAAAAATEAADAAAAASAAAEKSNRISQQGLRK
jgi:hypothetical protein